MMVIEEPHTQRECRIFFRYLCGEDPTSYISAKYSAAHRKVSIYASAPGFDDSLVRFAIRGPVFTRIADSYASLFAKRSTLRRKLILLLAILESSPQGATHLDRVDSTSKLALAGMALLEGLRFSAGLIAGIVLLAPSRLFRGTRKSPEH
jgi:hypothetical protein